MTTMTTYTPAQTFHRDIYNYSLPEDFYYGPVPQSAQPRSSFHYPDNVPRSMFINPQHLMVASPISPSPDDFFSNAPCNNQYNYGLEERSPVEYTQVVSRKHSAPAVCYPNEGIKSNYALQPSSIPRRPRSDARMSCPSPPMTISMHPSTLPTPPLSPSSTISTPPLTPTSRPPNPPSPSLSGVTITTTPATPSQRFKCADPSCATVENGNPRSFSRRADLQRHHDCAHEPKALYSCPRPNCQRKGDNGFTRQDHLIEHRRGYHGENIAKRGRCSSGRVTKKLKGEGNFKLGKL